MIALSPSKLISTPAGGAWFRLARTSDGLLCLESISDDVARNGPSAYWAFRGDVPPHIATQLDDDDSPDQVARVLDRALRALRYM